MENEIRQGKGFGYTDRESGTVCMVRCFRCGKENYAPTVATGYCAWCEFNPNQPVCPYCGLNVSQHSDSSMGMIRPEKTY